MRRKRTPERSCHPAQCSGPEQGHGGCHAKHRVHPAMVGRTGQPDRADHPVFAARGSINAPFPLGDGWPRPRAPSCHGFCRLVAKGHSARGWGCGPDQRGQSDPRSLRRRYRQRRQTPCREPGSGRGTRARIRPLRDRYGIDGSYEDAGRGAFLQDAGAVLPTFSPDGSFVAYWEVRNKDYTLHLLHAEKDQRGRFYTRDEIQTLE